MNYPHLPREDWNWKRLTDEDKEKVTSARIVIGCILGCALIIIISVLSGGLK